jgi:gamma-glutamyl phosphate reductase
MTAVQWFGEQALNYLNDEQKNNLIEAFKQALEMEKQQIIDAVNSQRQLGWDEKGEQYYNKTYKKETT